MHTVAKSPLEPSFSHYSHLRDLNKWFGCRTPNAAGSVCAVCYWSFGSVLNPCPVRASNKIMHLSLYGVRVLARGLNSAGVDRALRVLESEREDDSPKAIFPLNLIGLKSFAPAAWHFANAPLQKLMHRRTYRNNAGVSLQRLGKFIGKLENSPSLWVCADVWIIDWGSREKRSEWVRLHLARLNVFLWAV